MYQERPHQYNPHHQQPYGQMMEHQQMDYNHQQKQMHEMCKNYHLYFMQFQTTEGETFEGIIEDMDDDGVIILIPFGDMERGDEAERQYGYGYGYFPRRFRRFRRRRLPFFLLRSLFFPYYY
ncbi:hypothetical protein GI584_13670 [Gracilibacillus salitolerans]|uniref:Uncharacterized protein n=1 Tax=Gracilibacillus salitolerans TaxID=2663022 RepID=A0A5Q2TJD1_9BACI|nr:hypothetical protein [Gracilibacillus salitolerans]QGH35024.1 hypothetical protein GI584_13670 [Gracilibacillus salitolerans]